MTKRYTYELPAWPVGPGQAGTAFWKDSAADLSAQTQFTAADVVARATSSQTRTARSDLDKTLIRADVNPPIPFEALGFEYEEVGNAQA